MNNKYFITKQIEKRIQLIQKNAKLGFISLPIFVFIIFFYFKDFPTPLLVGVLAVISLIIFLPYFYLKNKYESWYIQNVYPFITESLNKKETTVKFQKLLFNKLEVNNCDVFQNIDLIDSKFSIFIKSESYEINLARLNCFNYINYRVNNKDIKEGQKLPVFEGIFMCIKMNDFSFTQDLILISKNIPKSSSSISSLRFKNNLYLDGDTVSIGNNDFDLYMEEKNLNSLDEIQDILNFFKIYTISQYLIISIKKNKIFLIFPETEYFKVLDEIEFIEKNLDRDIYFIANVTDVTNINVSTN